LGISRASISWAMPESTSQRAQAALPSVPWAGSMPAMPAIRNQVLRRSKRGSSVTASTEAAALAWPMPVVSRQTSSRLQRRAG
jgi:hypothetical protein